MVLLAPEVVPSGTSRSQLGGRPATEPLGAGDKGHGLLQRGLPNPTVHTPAAAGNVIADKHVPFVAALLTELQFGAPEIISNSGHSRATASGPEKAPASRAAQLSEPKVAAATCAVRRRHTTVSDIPSSAQALPAAALARAAARRRWRLKAEANPSSSSGAALPRAKVADGLPLRAVGAAALARRYARAAPLRQTQT